MAQYLGFILKYNDAGQEKFEGPISTFEEAHRKYDILKVKPTVTNPNIYRLTTIDERL